MIRWDLCSRELEYFLFRALFAKLVLEMMSRRCKVTDTTTSTKTTYTHTCTPTNKEKETSQPHE